MQSQVDQVRRFNRFYTTQIGVLGAGVYGSPFSLTEVRVLYELEHREQSTASELGQELGLDAGYLSRILTGFKRQGLVDRKASIEDLRKNVLWLTDKGSQAFEELNVRSNEGIATM